MRALFGQRGPSSDGPLFMFVSDGLPGVALVCVCVYVCCTRHGKLANEAISRVIVHATKILVCESRCAPFIPPFDPGTSWHLETRRVSLRDLAAIRLGNRRFPFQRSRDNYDDDSLLSLSLSHPSVDF